MRIILLVVVVVLAITLVQGAFAPVFAQGIACEAYKKLPSGTFFVLCLWELMYDYIDPIDWMDDK